ncbi:hypothetical protein AU359_01360 [Micrococcus luteus]|uniref:hypothetical protein n=1 Tax=Micrococcus luteus TaxID=1270 RepID=UPI00079194D1|nr:hypothetical protein [Micrococcus luteus]KWW39086.1 hypothetical protein AU359_01360 [Micrococcus luteus]
MPESFPDIKIKQPLREFLESKGLVFEERTRNYIVPIYRADKEPKSEFGHICWGVPAEELDHLEKQASLDPFSLDGLHGLGTPSGHYEFHVRAGIGWRSFMGERALAAAISKVKVSEGTSADPRRSLIPVSVHRRGVDDSPEDIFDGGASGEGSEAYLHVYNSSEDVSVEISRQSALGILFGRPNSHSLGESASIGYSINVCLSPSGQIEDDKSKALRFAHSFLYELSVRNNVNATLVPKYESGARNRPATRRPFGNEVRFPRTTINPDLSHLYSYARDSFDNKPVSFLSFYQIIEYFYPRAIRESSIANIRRELQSVRFSVSSDEDILRVIRAGDSPGMAGELDQLKSVLRLAVRFDILDNYFSDSKVREYFSKRGPISGVRTVSPQDKGESLEAQVAGRIYDLRNRIVHAKDDPKYSSQEKKLLLPMSGEAKLLAGDVELVRLVAEEAISFFQ